MVRHLDHFSFPAQNRKTEVEGQRPGVLAVLANGEERTGDKRRGFLAGIASLPGNRMGGQGSDSAPGNHGSGKLSPSSALQRSGLEDHFLWSAAATGKPAPW